MTKAFLQIVPQFYEEPISVMNFIKAQTSPILSPNPIIKNLIFLKSKHGFVSIDSNSYLKTPYSWKINKTLNEVVVQKSTKRRKFEVYCSVNDNNGDKTSNIWMKWIPKGDIAEKVFRLISSATSSPICQYVSSPTTFLHSVDPRIKLVIFSLFNIFSCPFNGNLILVKNFFMLNGYECL